MKAQIRGKVEFKVNNSQWEIMRLIAENPQTTIQEMAEKIGMDTRAAEKNLDLLKNHGLISREGSDIGGYWRMSFKTGE